MFTIPNAADAAVGAQAEVDSVDLSILVAGINGDGVLQGGAVTAQGSPDMTVAVSAGQARIGGYFPFWAAQSAVTITAADGSNPRFDLIVVDYNGSVSCTAGTAAATPVFPAIPSNSIVLAAVYVPANDTTIGSNQIVDKRVILTDSRWVRFAFEDEFTGGSNATGLVGTTGWGFTANGTPTEAQQAAVAAHPGVWRIGSGATSGNDTRMHRGAAANTTCVIPTDVSRFRWIVSVPTVTSIGLKLGLSSDTSNVPSTAGTWGSDGVWFELVASNSTAWQVVTRAAGSPSSQNNATTVNAGSWYQLDAVRLQNGNWQFVVNNDLTNIKTSTTKPTAACEVGLVVETNTSSARTIDVDFFGLDFIPLTRY